MSIVGKQITYLFKGTYYEGTILDKFNRAEVVMSVDKKTRGSGTSTGYLVERKTDKLCFTVLPNQVKSLGWDRKLNKPSKSQEKKSSNGHSNEPKKDDDLPFLI